MFDEIRNIKSNKKDLKSFGLTIGIVFLIITGILFYVEKNLSSIFIYLAVLFIFSGIIFPIILKPLYFIWMVFAVILGWIMTRVILSITYYFIITPITTLSKIFGKDFLDLKKQAINDSYWNARPKNNNDIKNYEKQF